MALPWFLQTMEDIGGSLEDTEDTPKMVENSHGSTPFPKQNDPKNPTAVYPSESTPGNQTWEFLPWRKQRPARASSTASYGGIQVGFIQRVRKSD